MYILRLLATFALTVWTFFLLNFALYKLDSTAYAAPADVHGFDFFYYSFNSLFANYSSGGIEPVSVLARSLAMSATAAVALVFAVVLVFVVTSLYKSRDDNQMDTVVRSIKEHAESIEPFIDEHYGMTVVEAVIKLAELRAGLIDVVYFFSPTLRPGSPPQTDQHDE